MKLIGFILIALGILMIIIPGFMIPVKKNIFKAGVIEINKTENEWLSWPLYTGVVLAMGGVVLVLIDKKRNTN